MGNSKSKFIRRSFLTTINILLQVPYNFYTARDNGTIQIYNVQKKCLSYTLSNS